MIDGAKPICLTFQSVGFASPDAPFAVDHASSTVYEWRAPTDSLSRRPKGRQIDDAIAMSANPQTALTVFLDGLIDHFQSQRVYDSQLSFIRCLTQHLTFSKLFQGAVCQTVLNVIAEGALPGIKQIHPIEVVKPQQRVALPQPTVSLSQMLHLISLTIVAAHRIEISAIRQTEHALAIYKHLSVGQFHNLLHLTRRQLVIGSPVTCLGMTYHRSQQHGKEKPARA